MVEPRALPTDPDFARRVEQAEVQTWLDLEPVLDASRSLDSVAIDGAVLIVDRSTDSPHSRILNLGLQRPATAEILQRILHAATAAGLARLETEIIPIARPGTLARLLIQAGFHQTERSVVVARHTEAMPEPHSYFRIRLATAADTATILNLMQSVMPEAPDWLALLAGQVGRPRWRYYLAMEAGVACGLGAIHLSDDVAWLTPIWVLPEHRNRGTQAALIAHAVRDSAALGIEWITANYPAAIPGRTRNFERLGFSMVYQRRHFVWSATDN